MLACNHWLYQLCFYIILSRCVPNAWLAASHLHGRCQALLPSVVAYALCSKYSQVDIVRMLFNVLYFVLSICCSLPLQGPHMIIYPTLIIEQLWICLP